MLLLLMTLACRRSEPLQDPPLAGEGGPPPADLQAEAPPPPPPSAVRPLSEAPVKDPAGLYAQCKDRLEGPETDGECTTDADCVKAGCSSEMCVAAKTEGVSSTCEVRPCFYAVDTCGCHAGRCSWTLKAPSP